MEHLTIKPTAGYFGPSWGDHPPVPWISAWLSFCWLVPIFIFWFVDHQGRQRRRIVVETAAQPEDPGPREQGSEINIEGIVVLLASLEHSLPHLPKGRAVAGGLGKVVDLVARHHPTDIMMVHPMVQSGDKVDYGQPTAEDPPLKLQVDDNKETVKVFRHTRLPGPEGGVRVDFLLLSHPMFETRTKESIYPNPMSRRKVLYFFALWNQAVGALLSRHRVTIFHCPDFHTAIAPWYALPKWPRLRLLLVLHNAEYQGNVSTDMIRGERLAEMAKIFNLPIPLVKRNLICDGRFNMLQAAINFVIEHQDGRGVCAVSEHYAHECMLTYSILWRLPAVEGLANPMLDAERAVLSKSLQETKMEAKQEIQAQLGLNIDPDARVFVSLGRLVRQKGVDLLADIAPWLLATFDKAQLIIIGPVGDGFGHYAARKLEALRDDPAFRGRVFVKCEFMRVSESLKFGADFCLMPSRDEPFGYVDIEFAWRGALLVGAQAGGLGKVPGFYYLAQNRENLERLRRELRTVICEAMALPKEQLVEMSENSLLCDFPLGQWQRRLVQLYKQVRIRSTGGDVELGRIEGASAATATFMPYDTVDPQERKVRMQAAERYTLPISMIDLVVEESQVRLDTAEQLFWKSDEEFLTQELAEEDIAEHVQAKVRQDARLDINQVLEAIGTEIDYEREQQPMGKWLLTPIFGVALVHILVALGYVCTPLSNHITEVVATEWAMHGGQEVPDFLSFIQYFSDLAKWSGGEDPVVMRMRFHTLSKLGSVIGLPLVAALSRVTPPRLLLGVCLLLQLPLVIVLLPINPNMFVGSFLLFSQGLVSSSSLLFVVFSFMMSIKADMVQAALRMGALEMCRYCFSWLITAYVFCISPAKSPGGKMTVGMRLAWAPFGVLFVLTTLVPGVLLLFAPGPYRNDRMPGFDLGLMGKRKSFILMSLSDCVGELCVFPSTLYITWWMSNGWVLGDMPKLTVGCGVLLAVGTACWAKALSVASVHGLSFLMAVALLLAPPAILRAFVQLEVSTSYKKLGKSYAALAVSIFTLLLEGIRSSASWTVKIRAVNSRWRLLSYCAAFGTCGLICGALSPFVCQWMAEHYGSSFKSRNQKELAEAVLTSLMPFAFLQFCLQATAVIWIHQDLGISIAEQKRLYLRLMCCKGRPVGLVVTTGLVLGVIFYGAFYGGFGMPFHIAHTPDHLKPFHQCLRTTAPTCMVLHDKVDKDLFGIDKVYGQDTSGKFRCHQLAYQKGGDTYSFWAGKGRCMVYNCGNELELKKQGDRLESAGEVWSRMCLASGKNFVGVHLFEWPWNDIAVECESVLGPGGFNFLQVSPVTDHADSGFWTARYSPASWELSSRSGTREQFVDMVRRCRQAGVRILVDVVLNHMAAPYASHPEEVRNFRCGADANRSAELVDGKVKHQGETTLPCMSFTGKVFGNREYPNNREGFDRLERRHFHHYTGNEYSNCGLPPWSHNRFECDLMGLPDLDTEHPEVQSRIQEFLQELFEIGVTMLRIDAGRYVHPESLLTILNVFPWDFVVSEVYPGDFESLPWKLQEQYKLLGHITDFSAGWRVSQSMFDSYDWDTATYVNRTYAFSELLGFRTDRNPDDCRYHTCYSPVPEENTLVFIDNHDSQRERWKEQFLKYKPKAVNHMCAWDGVKVEPCVANYKMGLQYWHAQIFMLTWPYGDTVRLMSSYAFDDFYQGPPGTTPEGGSDLVASPVTCRPMPKTQPVDDVYETDRRDWICEHRWKGIPALARFRRLVGRARVKHKWSDAWGRLCFGRGAMGFVCLSRGFNEETRQGNPKPLDLQELQTGLPAGSYCNLADWEGPLPEPNLWFEERDECVRHHSFVIIDRDGRIVKGSLPSGGAIVLHTAYRRTTSS